MEKKKNLALGKVNSAQLRVYLPIRIKAPAAMAKAPMITSSDGTGIATNFPTPETISQMLNNRKPVFFVIFISKLLLGKIYKILLPVMKLTKIMMMAITSRIWINPPMVAEVTIPNNHKTMRTTAIFQSICCSPFSEASRDRSSRQ
jgi:hypothetical protein